MEAVNLLTAVLASAAAGVGGVGAVMRHKDACASPVDCELNGACSAGGSCVCDRGWKGAACGQLDIGPRRLAYGNGVTPNTSCWGGGPPVLDPQTGKCKSSLATVWGLPCQSNPPSLHHHSGAVRRLTSFARLRRTLSLADHLLVTEIAGSCGMATWARMSQTTHAVGDAAAGYGKLSSSFILVPLPRVLFVSPPPHPTRAVRFACRRTSASFGVGGSGPSKMTICI